jgi:hypothetical protein
LLSLPQRDEVAISPDDRLLCQRVPETQFLRSESVDQLAREKNESNAIETGPHICIQNGPLSSARFPPLSA